MYVGGGEAGGGEDVIHDVGVMFSLEWWDARIIKDKKSRNVTEEEA